MAKTKQKTNSSASVIVAGEKYVLSHSFRFEFPTGEGEDFNQIVKRLDQEIMAFRDDCIRAVAKSQGVDVKFGN